LKQIRDGIEDYWYFVLLQRAVANSEKMSSEWLVNAKKELQIEDKLIHTMTDYAQNPKVLLQKRARLADLLEEYYKK
jgi:hypothetical protein